MAIAEQLAQAPTAAEQNFSTAVLRDVKFQAEALGGQLRAAMDLARNTTPEGSAEFTNARRSNRCGCGSPAGWRRCVRI